MQRIQIIDHIFTLIIEQFLKFISNPSRNIMRKKILLDKLQWIQGKRNTSHSQCFEENYLLQMMLTQNKHDKKNRNRYQNPLRIYTFETIQKYAYYMDTRLLSKTNIAIDMSYSFLEANPEPHMGIYMLVKIIIIISIYIQEGRKILSITLIHVLYVP